MTAAIVEIGRRSPEQVAYDLAADERCGRYEVWLRSAEVQARAETLAAERRTGS